MKANKETGWKSELHGADEFQFEAEDGRAIFNNGVYKWVYAGEPFRTTCFSCRNATLTGGAYLSESAVIPELGKLFVRVGVWILYHYDKNESRECVHYCDKCLLALNLKGITKERMRLAKTLGELRDD